MEENKLSGTNQEENTSAHEPKTTATEPDVQPDNAVAPVENTPAQETQPVAGRPEKPDASIEPDSPVAPVGENALQDAALSWQQEEAPQNVVTPDVMSGYVAPQNTVAAPPPAKRSMALIAVIVVLILGIIGIVASIFLNEPPEKAVQKALDKTGQVMQTRSDKMIEELPALDQMYKAYQSTPQSTNFDLSLQGISGGEDDVSMAMLSNMLKGLGSRGNYAMNPEQNMVEFTAQIGLGEMNLIDGYLYYTPEEVAFGVPKFSKTLFSVVPATLKEDYFASLLYQQEAAFNESISAEYKAEREKEMTSQLEELQKSLSQSINMDSVLDVKAMQEELNKRLEGVYEGATYEKLANENGLKVYQVVYDGSAVKQTVVGMARYIYLESPIMEMYNAAFTEAMLGGMSYKEMMEQQIVKPIEQNMPEVPVTAIYQVDRNRVIRSAVYTVDPKEANTGSTSVSLDKAEISFTYDDKKDSYVVVADLQVTDLVLQTPYNLHMDISDTYENKLYEQKVVFTMRQQDYMDMTMNMLMKMDPEGKCDFNMDVVAQSGAVSSDYSYAMKMEVAAGGGVKVDGDKATWKYPAIDLKISEGSTGQDLTTLGSITLAWESETTPLAADYKPAKEFLPLFKMTQEQLDTEGQKYEIAMTELSNQLFGMLMGGSVSDAGIPESGPIPEDDNAASN